MDGFNSEGTTAQAKKPKPRKQSSKSKSTSEPKRFEEAEFPPSPGTYAPEEQWSDNLKSPRKSGVIGWIASRSKLFWILFGAIFLIVVVVAIVPTVILTRLHSVPLDPPTLTNVIPHSFMVDIKSSPEDNTRAAVHPTTLFLKNRFENRSSRNLIEVESLTQSQAWFHLLCSTDSELQWRQMTVSFLISRSAMMFRLIST
jgi:hypothetical protein